MQRVVGALRQILRAAGFASLDQLGRELSECVHCGVITTGVQCEGGVPRRDLHPLLFQDVAGINLVDHQVPGDAVTFFPVNQRPGGGINPGIARKRRIVIVDCSPPRQGQHLGLDDGAVDHTEQIVERLSGQNGGKALFRMMPRNSFFPRPPAVGCIRRNQSQHMHSAEAEHFDAPQAERPFADHKTGGSRPFAFKGILIQRQRCVFDHQPSQRHKIAHQLIDSLRREKIRVVFKLSFKQPFPLDEIQQRIHLRGFVAQLFMGHRQPFEFTGRMRHVVQDQRVAENRVTGAVIHRLQHIDKRYFLMGIGLKRGVAHAMKHIFKTNRTRKVGAKRQRIDKGAHHLFELFVTAVGDGRSGDDVRRAGGVMKQRLPDGGQHHIQRGIFALAEGLEFRREFRKNIERAPIRLMGRHIGTVMIQMEVEVGPRRGQFFFPVVQLGKQYPVGFPLFHPDRHVAIAQGRRLQRTRIPIQKRLINTQELAGEQSQPPAVDGNMMNGQIQVEPLLRQLH